MVKRQTVWLSTMMVLSLMLIGYYTMSNQSATTSSEGGASGATVSSTSVTEPASGSGATGSGSQPSGQGSSASGSAGTSQGQSGSQSTKKDQTSTATTSSSDDWFVSQETHLEQQMSEQISNFQQVLANNNASTDTISKAEQSLQNLENLKGSIAEARDAIIGDGFKECVIVPTASNSQMHVYVKSDKLAATDVVKIMNIVSQQLDIPMTSVLVTSHA